MYYKKIVISFIIFVAILSLAGCSQATINSSDEVPKDFNFSLVYGTYGKKQIDTFTGIIVKDLIEDGTVEANISFTENEMKDIYKKMMDFNIMGDLDLDTEQDCISEPPSLSIWNIEMNGEMKTIEYEDYCDYPQDVLNLLKLENYIHKILTSKEEYKELPEANGYYE